MTTLNAHRTAVGLQCRSTAGAEYLSVPPAKQSARSLTSRRTMSAHASRSALRVSSVLSLPHLPGFTKPPAQAGQTLAVQVYLHECLQKIPLFRPHLSLRLVSEKANAPESQPVEVTNWAHVDWVRPTVEDPGSKFYGTIHVPEGFGKPGALLITKLKQPLLALDEIYISNVIVGFGTDSVKFSCHSTVNSAQGERVFFSSDACLPSGTPEGIKAYRENELLSLQGLQRNGLPVDSLDKPRVRTDRIYQYDVYNDLSNPDVPNLCRPALGGEGMPFPRRLRTNRPIAKPSVDGRQPGIESRVPGSYNILHKAGLPISLPYLPIDEQFNETKTNGFLGDELRAALSLLPSLLPSVIHHEKDRFVSFHDVDAMFTEVSDTSNTLLQSARKILFAVHNMLWEKIQGDKFPVPKVRDLRQLDWPTDEEFGRQILAGQNPCVIHGVSSPWLTGTAFTDASVDGLLEGASLTQRVAEGARMFYVDYMAGFEDYIERVNTQKTTDPEVTWLAKDRCLHAARCLMYLRDDGHLVPVAIEVKRMMGGPSTVYTPLDTSELWMLIKEMFLSLDSGYHQLVSHYLRAHASTEPFILATMRNISALHPVFKLMRPHYRYTLHINTNARAILINAGGVLEQTFTTGRYTMEIASFVYKNVWRFDKASFETDLIGRGMVKVDASGSAVRDARGRVQPIIDYPYAEDGLQIWYAMKEWFGAYLRLYYDDTPGSGKQVTDDPEVMAFWKDVRENGHPDKKEGWFELANIDSLTEALTTIAWTASAHHAAVNFGQYDYSGYMPNRPSMITKPMPEKGSGEVKRLKANFQPTMLSYLPSPADTLQMVLLYKVLSAHAPNEEYLNNDQPEWIAEPAALTELSKFVGALDQLDRDIAVRNAGPSKIRGEAGSRGFPYTLLAPTSPGPGVTGRGIPSSTCI